MILDKKIKIKISSRTLNHYKEFFFNAIVGGIIEIKPCQLPTNSAVKINVKCDVCFNDKILPYYKYTKNISKYNIYTCKKCFNIKNKKTCLEKYGDENFTNREKSKKTCLEKYGYENVSKNKEIKIKKRETTFKNYSVFNPMNSDEIKLKFKKTMNNKYGGILMGSKIIKEKIIKINNDKYGFDNPFSNIDIKKKIKESKINKTIFLYKKYNIISVNDDIYTFCCDCNKEHNYNITSNNFYNRKQKNTILCTVCNPIGSYLSSGYELQLLKIIYDNYKGKIITNSRNIINPLELDIYLPRLKLAFEFNGVYWHNENNVDKKYHLTKTEECEKQGIQLIHIWEDDWIYKQEIVKSVILNKLGLTKIKIGARKTTIKEISDNKLIRYFLDKNHLQGFVGSKVKLGLFFDDELVSLMTFGKRRIAMGKKSTNDNEYELLRFCNKLNTNVIGGASKLFNYFINNYQPKEITTYADRSHSNDKLYNTLGFESQGKTQPNYYYIICGIRKHRFNYRKDMLVKEGFDSTKTEHQIMIDRKFYRIYDSGNLKYNLIL